MTELTRNLKAEKFIDEYISSNIDDIEEYLDETESEITVEDVRRVVERRVSSRNLIQDVVDGKSDPEKI